MASVSKDEVDMFLSNNRVLAEDLFLKHASLTWINKWLLQHGYSAVCRDVINSSSDARKSCCSQQLSVDINAAADAASSRAKSPDLRRINSHRPQGGRDSSSPTQRRTLQWTHSSNDFRPSLRNFRQQQSTILERNSSVGSNYQAMSKLHLRSDFAKAKAKSIFRTHEPSIDSERAHKLAERRHSLKSMRQCTSLPSTSGTMLSLLIQSNVNLPRYESKDEFYKRELRQTSEKDFFLEIVKDISHDLEIASLTKTIELNITILMEAEQTRLYAVKTRKGKRIVQQNWSSTARNTASRTWCMRVFVCLSVCAHDTPLAVIVLLFHLRV